MDGWQNVTEYFSHWPCGIDHVFLHGLSDGRIMTAVALEKWFDEEEEAVQRRLDEHREKRRHAEDLLETFAHMTRLEKWD